METHDEKERHGNVSNSLARLSKSEGGLFLFQMSTAKDVLVVQELPFVV